MNYAVVAQDGTSISGTQVPQTFSGLTPGQYIVYRFSGGMNGSFSFSPEQSVLVEPGQTAVITAVFETQPSLTVTATKDGQTYSGPLNYVVIPDSILEDVVFSDTVVPQLFSDLDIGSYSALRLSGGPANSQMIGVNPSSVLLTPGGSSQVTFQFTASAPPPSGPVELYTTSLFSDPSLKHYYRLEGNSTDAKGSLNGSDTAITYSTANGKFGQGAGMNGTSSVISLGSVGMSGSTPRTLSSWVKFNSISNSPVSIALGPFNTNLDSTTLIFPPTGEIGMDFSGMRYTTATGLMGTGVWHHVVGVYDGGVTSTSTVHIYLDGVAQTVSRTQGSDGTPNLTDSGNSIGALHQNALFLNGVVDDVAIFNRSLTATEVASLYSGGGSQQTTGTVTVSVTMNGQAYSGSVACGFLNSPSNIQVNSVPFSQSNLPTGTYNLNCAGGPPNSQLQSFSPSSTQTLSGGGTINFTVAYTSTAPPTLSVQSCTASPSTVWPGQGSEVGQGIVFSVPTPTGGTPPYNYSWTGSFSSSLQSQAIYPSQFGSTYTGNLTVTDSGTGGNQQSRQVSCSAQTYAATTAPQNVNMTISPSSPAAGQVVTITLTGLGFYSNTQVQLFGGLCGSNGCTASNVANSVSITGMQALAQLNNAATFTVYVGNNGGMLSQVGSFTVH